jgi:hypothetical protein
MIAEHVMKKMAKYMAGYWRKAAEVTLKRGWKECRACKLAKPLKAFKPAKVLDGRHYICRACEKQGYKIY